MGFRVLGLVFRIIPSRGPGSTTNGVDACQKGAHLLARPLGKPLPRRLQQPEGFGVFGGLEFRV